MPTYEVPTTVVTQVAELLRARRMIDIGVIELAGSSLVTVGDALPTLTDRVEGNLHYSPIAGEGKGKLYVARIMGLVVDDTFDRANGTLGTSSSGKVWSTNVGQPTVSGNKAIRGSASDGAVIPLNTAHQEVVVDLVASGAGFQINHVNLLLRAEVTGVYYYAGLAQVTADASSFWNLGIERNDNPAVGVNPVNPFATTIPFVAGRVMRLRFTITGDSGDLTLTLVDTVTLASASTTVANQSLASPRSLGATNGYIGLRMAGAGNPMTVDNLQTASGPGTLTWDSTDEFAGKQEQDPFTATAGANQTYTLTAAVRTDTEHVFLNGVRLRQTAYTIVGTTLTIIQVTVNTDLIDVVYLRA